jgi:hypothetical protein
VQRKLLFGFTLMLALASVYAGLLNWGPLVQYPLLLASIGCAVSALMAKEE